MDKKVYDGDDEIIFSGNFNTYENKLQIKDVLSYDFTFIFNKEADAVQNKDITITGEDKNVNIIFSNKIRNALGSGTTDKITVIKFNNGKSLLCSVYGSSIGNETHALSVVINFYLR